MTSSESFQAFVVDESKHGQLKSLTVGDLPEGDVLIRSSYSSLNYKDALAATGHPGVARNLPHVPGVDVVGVVETSEDQRYRPGDRVFVTGYELGAPRWGGWSQMVRVPAEWVVPLPDAISDIQVMALGTAGFTAAQCVVSLESHGITPDRGEILVTGASGGVGSIALALLAKLGYTTVAVTGKADRHEELRRWGAGRVIRREQLDTDSDKPLLKSAWAGAVDTVGGKTLATVIKQLSHRGCVAACGNVGGVELPMTVFPFILRGVTLDGIDSAQCPRGDRIQIWERLFGPWQLPELQSRVQQVPLSQIDRSVQDILAGQVSGRIVVDTGA